MLTPRQADAFAFIRAYCQAHGGVPPTIQEIADELETQKSGAHRIVDALVARGFLRRQAGRARAIEVIKTLEGGAVDAVTAERERCAAIADRVAAKYAKTGEVPLMAGVAREIAAAIRSVAGRGDVG